MDIEQTKKILSNLLAASAARQETQELSRITRCIDCDRKIPPELRQCNYQRCRRCSIRFEKQKLKKGNR
ncbi:hypothetical protein NM948_08340 [Pasteurella multocida]|uniref:DksA C4-type domain-containing protein n=1 Tax=Pasteurella multocida TaxID=747 RepID=A0A9X3UU60_PASMD|nr:hypothetical protein [Pasteurella multocida]MDA5623544.1 hypothetical protein [Pasteurella multocida]